MRTGENVPVGNTKLIEAGAQKWPEKINSGELPAQLAELAGQRSKPAQCEPENLGLFEYQAPAPPIAAPQQTKELLITESSEQQEPNTQEPAVIEPVINPTCAPKHSVYAAVLPVLLEHLRQPICANDLANAIEVNKGQLNIWLKIAVADGVVKKHKNPVRYSAKRGN